MEWNVSKKIEVKEIIVNFIILISIDMKSCQIRINNLKVNIKRFKFKRNIKNR